MQKISNRITDRRKTAQSYDESDRRRANYDRRKVPERRRVKPAMSPGGQIPAHNLAYMAQFIAQMSNVSKASHAEAGMLYNSPHNIRTLQLLRGLTIDSDIS